VTPTIAVVIPTYQRRRLFREALTSVVNARPDEIYIVDDGTDLYDVEAMVRRDFILPSGSLGYRIRWGFVVAPPMTVDTRMSTPRQGSLLNKALEMVQSDVVGYLCDDDLFAPGWVDTLREVWAREPGREIVRGTWLAFEDGETPHEGDPPCVMDATRGMTAGNFAHHISITRDRGAAWPTNMLNCLDSEFLHSVHRAGVDTFRVPSVGFAGWARRHAYQNGHHSDGNRHRNSFRPYLEAGYLEAER
jgi:glycosyltransferase involved in cell wall biosynthesis